MYRESAHSGRNARDLTPVARRLAQKAAGSQNRVYRTDLIRWESTSTLSAVAHPLGTGVPVEIAIPQNCLEITDPLERARQKRGTLRWVLQLKGQRPGLNYLASFAIPVK